MLTKERIFCYIVGDILMNGNVTAQYFVVKYV